MQTVLQLAVPEFLQEVIAETIAFTPRLIGALLVLLVGWFLGGIAARVVTRIADRVELDKATLKTPLGAMLGGTERAVSTAFGTLARWFVFAVAILAAANVLAIALLSEWVSTAVSYLPAFVAGLLVIVVGFVVADFIGDAILRTQAATETRYTGIFATGTRMFLYFTAVVIGLSTMGINVELLFTIAQAFAWGLAAAFAIGAGIALGWGGKDYVASNIGRWMGNVNYAATRSDRAGDGAMADGGHVDADPMDD
ncbi:mechanosensitive ion channel family protein [Halogeometricum limi]|uniref:Conserved TM helix n=1 Tax=Halogeometricum limi TaxID=555875 RepID=A0A1I6GRI6_9EURY|nr:hypothetical protein [Halogeometricum limi]SFR44822.1 Conserved TM helix [Halogeometricum limi]